MHALNQANMLGVVPPFNRMQYNTTNDTEYKLSILEDDACEDELLPSRVRTAPLCARRPQNYSTA